MSKTTWYTGIADNEGIESFIPEKDVDPNEAMMFEIRANANQHRFATTYRTELDDEKATTIMQHLKEHKWMNALKSLNNLTKNKKLVLIPRYKEYWNLITK